MKFIKHFNESKEADDIDYIFQDLLDDFPELNFKRIYVKAVKKITYRSKSYDNKTILKHFYPALRPYIEEINDRLGDIGLQCQMHVGGNQIYHLNIKINQKKYKESILEKYLEGHKGPLYHYTLSLGKILSNDQLKASPPAYGKSGKRKDKDKCICLTRSSGYSEHGNTRIVLDQNKLLKFGYKANPVDEIGIALTLTNKHKAKKFIGYSKVNPIFKTINHGVKGLKTGTIAPLEQEHEERIFKDINHVGRFIDYIDLPTHAFSHNRSELINFVKKYPHIIVREIGPKNWIEPTKILLDIHMIKDFETRKKSSILA